MPGDNIYPHREFKHQPTPHGSKEKIPKILWRSLFLVEIKREALIHTTLIKEAAVKTLLNPAFQRPRTPDSILWLGIQY